MGYARGGLGKDGHDIVTPIELAMRPVRERVG
jgi:hypothetical protein